MNVEATKVKRTNGHFKKWLSICICCLIIGFLVGVALDAKYRPNNILLYINPDGKESLSPQPGDIISFAADKDPKKSKVSVSYTANLTPCENTPRLPPSTCVYKPFDKGPDLYLFSCTFGEKNKPCYDPQYGPKCVGCGAGPGTGGSLHPHPTQLHWPVLIWDLKALFRQSPYQQILPQSQGGQAGGGGQPRQVNGAPVQGTTSSVLPPRVQEYVAACDSNGKPAVFASGQAGSTTLILAEPGDTITWIPYAPYTTMGLGSPASPLICADGNNPSDVGNQSCIINSPLASKIYSYSLNMTCGNVADSTPENIRVENLTAPPPEGKK